jgi:molybdenum cofactor biosynthesis protein B
MAGSAKVLVDIERCYQNGPWLRGPYNRQVSTAPLRPQHRETAPASVRCAVLTISDTRTEATDTSGDAIVSLLAANGHQITSRSLVKDDPAVVRQVLRDGVGLAQIVITTGGTGITSRDSTYEAIASLLEKRLDGFGELFRMLSFHEIGAAAMLSRACAGTIGRTAVFSLPGSEPAVRLAMTSLILPEIGHVVRELER